MSKTTNCRYGCCHGHLEPFGIADSDSPVIRFSTRTRDEIPERRDVLTDVHLFESMHIGNPGFDRDDVQGIPAGGHHHA
jgi:hypothetical protein